eukprot:UN14504
MQLVVYLSAQLNITKFWPKMGNSLPKRWQKCCQTRIHKYGQIFNTPELLRFF